MSDWSHVCLYIVCFWFYVVSGTSHGVSEADKVIKPSLSTSQQVLLQTKTALGGGGGGHEYF